MTTFKLKYYDIEGVQKALEQIYSFLDDLRRKTPERLEHEFLINIQDDIRKLLEKIRDHTSVDPRQIEISLF